MDIAWPDRIVAARQYDKADAQPASHKIERWQPRLHAQPSIVDQAYRVAFGVHADFLA
jgi:hypothetical protein